jgi:hydrogenase maturation protease
VDSRSSLLILGLGNLLCRDDGLGVLAVQAIAGSRVVPDGVKVLDGGTLGLSLLPYLEDADRAILVDAVQANAPAGTIVRIEGEAVGPAVSARLSVHQVGVSDLIEAARWRDRIPPTLVLLGAVPLTTELGVGLSGPVLATFPDLVSLVCQEAQRLGFALDERPGDDPNAETPGRPGCDGGFRLLRPAG